MLPATVAAVLSASVSSDNGSGITKPPPVQTPPRPDQEPPFEIPPSEIPPSRILKDYFVDDDGFVHESNINTIAYNDITYGWNVERTHYCSDDLVTRTQMAGFLARALDL